MAEVVIPVAAYLVPQPDNNRQHYAEYDPGRRQFDWEPRIFRSPVAAQHRRYRGKHEQDPVGQHGQSVSLLVDKPKTLGHDSFSVDRFVLPGKNGIATHFAVSLWLIQQMQNGSRG